ncbi:unnamed protein product [Ceratitis capitata]|uniref:(Mediterranean fruit fly) hypothetical protein n=1 Tax=Ceratitis capitata TaxID=7213 RepID=A0A811VJ02_CERCA|nr:unnamed protein product [Ceratitis capitata]
MQLLRTKGPPTNSEPYSCRSCHHLTIRPTNHYLTMSIWLWVHGYAAGHPSRSPIDGRCRASASQAVSYRWSACVWLNAAADLIRARNENTKSTYNDQPSHKPNTAQQNDATNNAYSSPASDQATKQPTRVATLRDATTGKAKRNGDCAIRHSQS